MARQPVAFWKPREVARPEDVFTIKFYGQVRELTYLRGRLQVEWLGGDDVIAMPYDVPVPGYACDTVNTLRLWAASVGARFQSASIQSRRLCGRT